MRATRDIMGMPVTVEIVDGNDEAMDAVFDYFHDIDARFSTYKDSSEISRINRGELAKEKYSKEMQEVFVLAEKTKEESNGYFSIVTPSGVYDPSGIVKGWAIKGAANLIAQMGYTNYFLDVGGDIQPHGVDADGNEWSVGIRSPFSRTEIVKVLHPHGHGVATSGSYIRGNHIYNPHAPTEQLDDIVSITVIGPDVFEADRFATAAFAMGRSGIMFIEQLPGFEGYQIDKNGIATETTGFAQYL